MTYPIDDYLEGKVRRTDLTPSEQLEADAAERAVRQVGAFVVGQESPDLTRAVMSRIDRLGTPVSRTPRGGVKGWLAILWAPRDVSFQFRPVYAVLGTAVLAALAVLATTGGGPVRTPELTRTPAGPQLFVQFRLQAPDAMTVRLAGTFTDWQPRYDLHEAAPGVWTITVPLSPGVHDYVFVVNGEEWVPDPHAQQIDDGFGGRNSRIALLAPDTSRS